MIEPCYTYKAAGPCFSIEHDKPFVLQGCSCGWPSTVCLRWNGRTVADREKPYAASIQFHARQSEGKGS